MLYLLLAIASSALVSVLMRLSGARVKGNVSMLAMNYLMCLLLAAAFTGPKDLLPAGEGSGLTVGLGLFNGLLYLLGFILLQVNVRRNGVVLSATFMKLGLLVPMTVSVLFFREVPDLLQVTGFLMAVGAIILINFEKEQSALSFKAGLILMLLINGGADAMSKVFEELGNPAHSEQFLLFTFAAALVLCGISAAVKRERPGRWEGLFGLLIGVPNYFSARFLLRSLEDLNAVIVYPTYSVATIVVVTLAGVCFFREKLGRRQWLAIGVILAALVLLNV